ncbi:restriction endonuclease subunit S [Paenibacillus lautus]|uniref:restriction endonuclease subunit S n=1 Tax=Paenibacillus lautus TaxID=1401 RepID=UPI00385063CE
MSKWEKVRLGDVCEVIGGSTPKTSVKEYWDGEILWITPAELNDTTIIIRDTQRKITDKAISELSLKKLPVGTVLLSSRAPIGKVAITGKEMYCNQGFKNLVCSESVFNKYLFWFLKGKGEFLNSLGRGATFKEISKSTVENIVFPLPPLEVQKQIAATLDAAFELLILRKQQLSELDELIKSVFYEMFGDPVRNEKGWELYKLNEVAKIDTIMTKDFKKYAEYPHIGIDSIEKNTGQIIDYKLVKDSGLISGKYLFSDKHIIYSKIRPNLNKVALPHFSGLCSADAYPILPIEIVSNRIYLAYILRSTLFLNYILDYSGRTNIPKVNKKQLEGFHLPLPPLDLQNQFADIVTKIEEQKTLVKQNSDETQQLFDSLMSQYFDD